MTHGDTVECGPGYKGRLQAHDVVRCVDSLGTGLVDRQIYTIDESLWLGSLHIVSLTEGYSTRCDLVENRATGRKQFYYAHRFKSLAELHELEAESKAKATETILLPVSRLQVISMIWTMLRLLFRGSFVSTAGLSIGFANDKPKYFAPITIRMMDGGFIRLYHTPAGVLSIGPTPRYTQRTRQAGQPGGSKPEIGIDSTASLDEPP